MAVAEVEIGVQIGLSFEIDGGYVRGHGDRIEIERFIVEITLRERVRRCGKRRRHRAVERLVIKIEREPVKVGKLHSVERMGFCS